MARKDESRFETGNGVGAAAKHAVAMNRD